MKKPLLLLHGALGGKSQLEPLKNQLASHFEVYTLNFEGHGGDTSKSPFSIKLFTQNVLDFIETEKLTQVNIFGYSMGGYVALNLASQHPQVVSQIITLGTKFDWTPESSAREVKMLNPDVIEEKVPHFANKLSETHKPADWKSVVLRTAEMMKKLGNIPAVNPEKLKQITQKVIIGIGNKDQMVSLEESTLTASHLPNGTLHVFESFPHPIYKVDLDVLCDFLVSKFDD